MPRRRFSESYLKRLAEEWLGKPPETAIREISLEAEALQRISEREGLDLSEKQIAGYGTVRGQSRRIQVYGSGKQLNRVMLLASQHPPRTRFLTIDASKLLNNPWRYLSREDIWDAKPRVDS